MLIALIASAWLTAAALCWAVCAMAARGDAEFPRDTDRYAPVVAWESVMHPDGPRLTVRDARIDMPVVR